MNTRHCKNLIIILVSLYTLGASAKTNCEGTPWVWSRDLNKQEMHSVLSQTQREKLKSMAIFELTHSNHRPVALPLTLYLANTEMNKSQRGFWKTMAYITTQGETPETIYMDWPNKRGRKSIPLSKNEICKFYQKTE